MRKKVFFLTLESDNDNNDSTDYDKLANDGEAELLTNSKRSSLRCSKNSNNLKNKHKKELIQVNSVDDSDSKTKTKKSKSKKESIQVDSSDDSDYDLVRYYATEKYDNLVTNLFYSFYTSGIDIVEYANELKHMIANWPTDILFPFVPNLKTLFTRSEIEILDACSV